MSTSQSGISQMFLSDSGQWISYRQVCKKTSIVPTVFPFHIQTETKEDPPK